MDFEKEISEISRLIHGANLLMAVRKEVRKVMKEGFVVTDGEHHSDPSGASYDVVVRCADEDNVARRIRSGIPDIEVERLADGAIGIRSSRRES